MARQDKGPSVLDSGDDFGSANLRKATSPAHPSVGILLPGRRRLMRSEDTSGSDSEGGGDEGSFGPVPRSPALPSLPGSAGLRSRNRSSLGKNGLASDSAGEDEVSCGFHERFCASFSPRVPVTKDSGSARCSAPGADTCDVINVKSERASLSQTFLTSWLVMRRSRG